VTEPGLGPPPEELPSGSPVDSIEAALGMIPPKQAIPPRSATPDLTGVPPAPRWLGPLALCCLVGMLPWIIFLAFTIPQRSRAEHYDLAWIGFDCAMWLVLAALAFFALRRHPATGPVAAVASTMLVVDAWFDITTSSDEKQFAIALVLACVAELPLAIICGWAAVNAERIRARAYRGLHMRWELALRLLRERAGAVVGSDRTGGVVSSPPAAPPRR
jgi:hypothetical protein